MSDTIRLTVAQATVEFLANQWSERDGERQKLFADYRRQADPDNRLLDSYFRDLLS